MDPTSPSVFLISAAIIFFGGLLGGWLASGKLEDIERDSVRIAVAFIVTFIWMISVVAEILIPAYTVSVVVHGIMGALVGYLFSKNGDGGFNIRIGGK